VKHEHQNPREGIRIALPFDEAIRRALNTKPPAEPKRPARSKRRGTTTKRKRRA